MIYNIWRMKRLKSSMKEEKVRQRFGGSDD